MKAYITEDQSYTRLALMNLMVKLGYEICGTSSSAEKAAIEIPKLKPDICLVDIHLSGEKDGVWLVTEIRKALEIPIIYLTAHKDSETIEAVRKTNPEGYLIKPYHPTNLEMAIDIAMKNFVAKTPANYAIYVKVDRKMVKIGYNEILYLQSKSNYVTIFTDKKKFVSRAKLSDMILNLDPNVFKQSHLRYIVNTKKIKELGHNFIRIQDSIIPISDSHKENFQHMS